MNVSVWFLMALVSGCGYQWGSGGQFGAIEVPFVQGDVDGSLTCALVHGLAASGRVVAQEKSAQYSLHVAIVDTSSETVGYRRDQQKISGEIKKNLLAVEARKKIVVEMSLYKTADNTLVYGPVRLEADSDYDYLDGDSIQDLAFIDTAGIQQTVLPFSLGQLESKETAQEATGRPLYKRLVQTMIDALFEHAPFK
jgi:hypothetical protein